MNTRRRWLHLAASLSLAAILSGCAANALRQARSADELRDYDLAVASYLKALREHPSNRDAQLGLERAKLRAAEVHLAAGRRLHSQGRDEDALVELQLASEFNPGDSAIAEQLRQVRIARRTELNRPETGQTALETLLARSRDFEPAGYALPNITLPAQITTGQQSTVRTLYLMLARLGNLSITFDSQFRDNAAPVSLMSGVSLKLALDSVAQSTDTFYQVIGPNAIVVIPDTPQKRREYTDEVLRQFTIQNADLKETMDALRVVGDIRYIAPISGTNQILVRDSPDRLRAVAQFISQFDKARPEVVVDVEVLEVNRNRMREYGLQIASPGSTGIDGSADANRDGLTLQSVRNLSQADVLMTNIPALYYRLLKTDTRTRTLANPHIRITDGTAATAKFGQDVPVPKLTIAPIAQGGINIQPQTQFDYRTIGVNIGITPRTHANDDVTLALTIELSSIGAPGFDGLPTFGQRNVTTSIRLKDGETNILAGLIREDERTEHQTIPGVGDVPILGNLFARNHKEADQTDVVIMLTPHIIRALDMTEEDLRPLRLPREGAAGAPSIIQPIFQPAPIVPARDNVPAQGQPNAPGQQTPGQQTPNGQPNGQPNTPAPSQLPPGAGAPRE